MKISTERTRERKHKFNTILCAISPRAWRVMKNIKSQIAFAVAQAATNAGFADMSADELLPMLTFPPDETMGDIALPCFKFAKTARMAPDKIAATLAEGFTCTSVQRTEVAGGYLNFFLNKSEVLKEFFDTVKNGALVDTSEYSAKNVTIEHTSVNPNASPHIGRARNAMIGDATVRLFRYMGCRVKVRYFVNDIGKQIALLVYCTKDKTDISFGELLDLYVAANEEAKVNKELENAVFDILARMENGDEEVFAMFARIVDICVKGQMQIFNEFGIFYDQYDYESEYVKSGKTEEVLAALNASGRLFEDEENRLVLNLDEFGINSENPYLPLTRKDKTSLYPLRDICYNIDKSADNAFRNIIVLGEDQKLYGRQINAALSLIGVGGAEIINYSFVLLPEGKMSTRAGQVVLLEDLMHDTMEHAKTTIAEHRKDGNLEQLLAKDTLPKQLAYGAIKYAILKCGSEKNVIFDKETALNFQGDTSVYIQYSYARISSLLQGEEMQVQEGDLALLTHPIEWELVKKAMLFGATLESVLKDFNFSTLCTYLFELCQHFSRWYKECPIKTAEPNLKNARLFLADTIADIIKDGLYVLGIETPEKI